MATSLPFSTQTLALSPYFTDRDAKVRRVLQVMRSAQRLVLYGERRMGKSSIIARACERIEAEGGVVVSVDLWTVDGFDALNHALLASVPGSWLTGERLDGLLQALRGAVTLSVDEEGRPSLGLAGPARGTGGGSGGSSGGRPEGAARFERIVRAIDATAAHHQGPVVMVMDEFQALEGIREGAGALLRAVVQDTPNLAWVLAGSIVGLVLEQIGPRGPFHAIDRMEVGGIDRAHLVPWIQHRLTSHGVAVDEAVVEDLYERAAPVTEYVLRLAKGVHRRGQATGRADADTVQAAFDEVVADHAGGFELIWNKLAGSKRQILRAVANGEQALTARDVLDRHGLASSSAAQYAINALREDAILAPGKPFRVSDPFFAAWVRGMA